MKYRLLKNNSARILPLFLSLVFIVVSFATSLVAPTPSASALSGSQFNAGRIIDDAVFYNKNAMNATQIQSFLNSKVPTCNTNHTKSNSANDSGPPYICLKSYKQNTGNIAPESGLCNGYQGKSGETAAQIIYNVAQSCGINPQVILVMLQKEQGLITDTWPWDIQYRKAMGAFCPDTAPCDPDYAGFFYQVYYGAHRFKVYRANQDSFNYKAGRNNYILYNPNTSCGGSNVYIQNQATAGLYIYTPYQPNPATLKVGLGVEAPCGAYGNKNFWWYFNLWFGSPTGPGYAASSGTSGVFGNSARTQSVNKIGRNYFTQPGQTSYATVKITNSGRNTWFRSNTRLATASPYGRKSVFATGNWIAPHRAAPMSEESVAPGQTATFQFDIKAPATPNLYTEQFQVVVEGVAWVANYTFPLHLSVVNALTDAELNTDFTLEKGAVLGKGNALFSPERHSMLRLQENGNLELYKNFKLVWQSNTSDSGATTLVNQADGNLVLYSPDKAVWNSRTSGKGESKLIVQSDGNLVLYPNSGAKPWNTSTAGTSQRNTLSIVMDGKTRLYPGQALYSPDKKRVLILQPDGNLVLYSSSKAVWSSRTFGKNVGFLALQSDGNLVLYSNGGKAFWSSRTHGNGHSSLVLQQDGNLVLYSTKKATWHSSTRNK